MNQPTGIISVRKVAALDLIFHGPRFILLEFGLGLVVCAALGAWLLFTGLSIVQTRLSLVTLIGAYLLGIAVNYIPLLLHSIQIIRQKSAVSEVGDEISHPDQYQRMYNTQTAVFLLFPLGMFGLAVYQALQKK